MRTSILIQTCGRSMTKLHIETLFSFSDAASKQPIRSCNHALPAGSTNPRSSVSAVHLSEGNTQVTPSPSPARLDHHRHHCNHLLKSFEARAITYLFAKSQSQWEIEQQWPGGQLPSHEHVRWRLRIMSDSPASRTCFCDVICTSKCCSYSKERLWIWLGNMTLGECVLISIRQITVKQSNTEDVKTFCEV